MSNPESPAAAIATDPEFGPLLIERRAGGFASILTFVLGIVLMFAFGAYRDGETRAAIVLAALAVAFIAFMLFVSSGVRLRMFEHGIEWTTRFSTKRMAWDHLASYRLEIMDPALLGAGVGGLGGVIGARLASKAIHGNNPLTPTGIALIAHDGTKIDLTSIIAGYKKLVPTLVSTLVARLAPGARSAYESGAVVSFGKRLSLQRGVGITVTARFGAPKVLPIEQAASARLEQAQLVIRRNDTDAVWASVPTREVSSPGVFQSLVEAFGRPYVDPALMAWSR